MLKRRILIFTSSFRIGGSERQALELFRHMDREKYDPRLASFSTEGPLSRLLPCPLDDVQVYPLRGFYRKSCLDQARRFYRYLTTEQIEVVQCFDFYSNLFAVPVARLAGVPIILGTRREEAVTKSSVQRLMQRWVYGLATGVIANASSIRDLLVENEQVSPARVWAIPNGLDLDAFDAVAVQSRRIRNDDVIRFGVLANLRPEKGHEVLLDAVARLVAQHQNIRVLIAGEGPMRGAIEAQIRRLRLGEIVELLGEVKDVPSFLVSLDGMVLPSIMNEGFPNAVMEAMAASLPVVATDSGGTRDLVVEGETGFIVPTRNVAALVSKVDVFCRDAELRRKMGEAGRWRIARHFTAQCMAQQYERLYDALCARRGA